MRGYDTCHASFHFRAFPWLLDLGQTQLTLGQVPWQVKASMWPHILSRPRSEHIPHNVSELS